MIRHPPWPHQQAAYDFVKSRPYGAMLAMAMGTGKSRVAIDLIQTSDARRILIACPKSVIQVWPSEFEKHACDLSRFQIVALDHGTVAQRTAQAAIESGARTTVVIGNYEMMWREPFRSWALAQDWDVVINDESHRIRGPGSKVSRFMATLGTRVGYRLALTGTPMPHSPLDLYAQMRFVDPTIFGTRVDAFKLRYCFMGGFSGYQILGWQHLDELHDKFYQAAFRVSSDVLHLPPEVDTMRYTVLEPKAKKHYKELQKNFITATARGEVTVSNALTKLLRLAQITGGWLKHEDGAYEAVSTAKLDLLNDTLDDLPVDVPTVIFCRFHRELDAVHGLLRARGRTVAELSGRHNHLGAWQAGAFDDLVVQIQAGAEGNDLTRSHYTIYFSQGLSLGNYQQSRKRTSRPGQTAAQTTFIHLIARGTVDETIYRTFARNGDLIQTVLRDGP